MEGRLDIVLLPAELSPLPDPQTGRVTTSPGSLAESLASSVAGLAKVLAAHGVLPRDRIRVLPQSMAGTPPQWWPAGAWRPPEWYDDQRPQQIASTAAACGGDLGRPTICFVPTLRVNRSAGDVEWWEPTGVSGARVLAWRMRPEHAGGRAFWSFALRAVVAMLCGDLAGPRCETMECLGCLADDQQALMTVVPSLLCGQCRARLTAADAASLAALAAWAASNGSERADDVGKQRIARVRSLTASGDRPVRIDNLVLEAHAERVRIRALASFGCYVGLNQEVRHFAPQVTSSGEEGPRLIEVADEALDAIGAARGIMLGLCDRTCNSPIPDVVRSLDLLIPQVDSLLHATTKRGRDHAAHMAATAMFSQLLLDTAPDHEHPARTLAYWAQENTGLAYEDVCLAAWFAAMFHDIGYPFAKFLSVCWLSQGPSLDGNQPVPFGEVTRDLYRAIATILGSPGGTELADGDPRRWLSDRLSTGNATVVEGLLTWLRDREFCGWMHCPAAVESLVPGISDEGGEGPSADRLLNHGLISAAVCVAALDAAGLSPLTVRATPWLPRALQAIALHDYELSAHPATRRSAGHPLGAGGGRPRTFSFDDEPITFLLRLADKVHVWERYVHGKYGLVQEAEYVDLQGLHWPLDGNTPPQWLGPPTIGIVFGNRESLAAAGWEHDPVHDDLCRYLAELPFPDEWRLPRDGNERAGHMRFRLTLPEVDPGTERAD